MIFCTRCLLAAFTICLAVGQARGQEGPAGVRAPGAPGAATVAGPEKKYADLAKSKDRVIKATAERYLNLIKFQEWGGASGKTQMAKYVSHELDLKRVKLSVAKGSGKDRVVKEFDVEVEKLNKVGQARVKQIDVLQKRLDELSAAAAAKGDGTVGPASEVASAGPGAIPTGPEATPAGPGGEPGPRPGVPAQAAPEVDASASEPDPIGFAELPPAAAVPPVPGGAPPEQPPEQILVPNTATPREGGPNKSWQKDYETFRANFQNGPSKDAREASWGSLDTLKMAAAEVKKWEATGEVGEKEHREIAKKFAVVGEFEWEATLAEADVSTGDWTKRLNLPPLPEPFSIGFVLERERETGKWQNLKTGDRVRFVGRFVDVEGDADIVAAIRFPDQK